MLFQLLLVLSALLLTPGLLHGATATTTAWVDVNVITMTSDEVLSDQTVIVEGGRIAAIGPSDTMDVPDEAEIIRGGYLMPGLAEMHAHIPSSREAAERVLAQYIAQGVTTIRGMLGAPLHLQLRAESAAGELFAPRIIAGAPSLNGNSVRSAEHGVVLVREYHAAGYDHLKIHPGLSRAEFDAIADTANALSMRFAGHVPADVGLQHALAKSMSGIDHLDGMIEALAAENSDQDSQFFGVNLAPDADLEKLDALMQQVAASGSWQVPTQSLLIRTLGQRAFDDMLPAMEARLVDPGTLVNWRNAFDQLQGFPAENRQKLLAVRRQMLTLLHEHGANILLGSDAPQILNVPGYSVLHELESYVASGMSHFEALATGTVAVGEYLDDHSLGTISEGAVADLVLLAADPLEDLTALRHVRGVMRAGVWRTSDQLNAELD